MTKGLNIAGKLNIAKLLLLTIYVLYPERIVAISMQFQVHNLLEKLEDAWAL